MTVTVAGVPAVGLLLASVRIVAWLALVPPFSARAVPTMAKAVLSVALAVAAAPLMPTLTVPVSTGQLLLAVVNEAFVGAAMGFVTYLLFGAIAAAGSMIDVFGGFSLAQGFDPLGLTMNTVMGKLHQALATVLLFASGGHLLVMGGLLRTFDLLPVGVTPELGDGVTIVTRAFELFFVTAVQIALPMIAVLFIADLGVALMTKVAPQLNAINVVFPAKIGLTLLLVGMSFPVLPGAVDRLTELVLQATSALAGGAG